MDDCVSFDGWELRRAASAAAVVSWRRTPGPDDGLLVDHPGAPPGSTRSLCLLGATLDVLQIGEVVGGLDALALVDCAFAGGFAAIAASSLRSLWIQNAHELPMTVLRPLAAAHRLERLHLDGVAPGALTRNLAALTALRELDLSRPADDPAVGRSLDALAALPALAQFGLRRAQLTDSVLQHLATWPALRRLDLSGSVLPISGKAWRGLGKLETLRLHALPGNAEPRVLEALWTLEGLKEVDLRGVALSKATRGAFHADMPKLRVLADPAPETRTVVAMPRPPEPPPARAAAPIRASAKFPGEAPRIADLHAVVNGDRGEPIGFDLRYDLPTIAQRFDPAQLLAALAGPLPAESAVVALLLLPAALASGASAAEAQVDAVISAALARVGDSAACDWQWAAMPHQCARFVVGRAASQAVIRLLEARARRRRAGLAEDLAAIEVVLRAELTREDGEPYLVSAHLFERSQDPGFSAAASAWLMTMTAIIDDPDAPSRARICALERLSRDEARLRQLLPEPTTTVWQRTLESLARHALAAETEMRFRRAARKLVAERAPELFDALRAAGSAPSRALPPYARLVDGIGYPDPARVLPIAPEVDGATCIAALNGDDIGAWFAALALAPYCGDGEEAQHAALAAARLVGRNDSIALADAPSARSARLGDVAATAVGLFVRKRAVPRAGLFEILLARAEASELEPQQTTPAGLQQALEATAPADGEAVLAARFLDRGRPAAQRFQWLLLSFPIRRDHAQRVLEDASEDGDLRALIGCLSGLVQPAHLPPLPLCEPDAAVSLDNLKASLAIGRHPHSLRRAISALVGRLLPWTGGAALAIGAAQLRALPQPPELRAIVDGAEVQGREAAARWLAVAGAQEDEARLARMMVEHGAWTAARSKTQADPTAIEQLLAVLSPESVIDHCDSLYDPLLVLGYGEAGAARIRAKAYAAIARRHAAAGRDDAARRSLAFAAALDPMNLEVARLKRTLGA